MLSVHFERRPAVYQPGHGRNVWSLLFEPVDLGRGVQTQASTPTKKQQQQKTYKVHLLFFLEQKKCGSFSGSVIEGVIYS